MAKKTSVFENTLALVQEKQEGLFYNTATIGELVEKDMDGDTIPDWQETLYGLDPNNKETTPGIPDSTVIEKLRLGQEDIAEATSGENQNTENLTETDKFSRELFAIIASLNQDGPIDQLTVEQITNSLSEEVRKYTPQKIFTLSDIKITKNDSQSMENYKNILVGIFKKDKIPTYNVVLEKFIVNKNNVDNDALVELEPMIESMKRIIVAMAKMEVPQSFTSAHLDFLNAMERVVENLDGIRNYKNDPIVALKALNQFKKNSTSFTNASYNFLNTITKK